MADLTITLASTDIVERHDHLPLRADEAPFAYVRVGDVRIVVVPGAEQVAEYVGAQLLGAARSVRVHAGGARTAAAARTVGS